MSSNPYVGPRSFRRGELLFGRKREVAELLNLLIAERVVLLYSPSGAGKSSLINAALVPALEKRRFRVLPTARVNQAPPAGLVLPDGANRYLLSVLLSVEESHDHAGASDPAARTPLAPETLAGMDLPAYLRHRNTIDGSHDTVLIIDQFEEILTLDPTDTSGRKAFFEHVGTTLVHEPHLWLLLSMREDYIAMLDPYLRPIPNQLNDTYRLDLLTHQAARQAIQEPALRAGVAFADDAADQLITNLSTVQVQGPDGKTMDAVGPYVEPVQLQVVCRTLWEKRNPNDHLIDATELKELASVDQALGSYYATSVARAATESGIAEREIRRWCGERLITPGKLRGQVQREGEQAGGLPVPAIQALVNTHVVRSEPRRGVTWYELAHDRLIRPVQDDNRRWQEANLSLLQRQAQLWEQQQFAQGLHLQGRALAQAEQWARTHPDELTDLDQRFLQASRQARRSRQFIWAALATMVVLAVLSGALAIWANQARAEAELQEERGLVRSLSAEALSERDYDQVYALLLAVEAARRNDPDEPLVAPDQALRAALASPPGVSLGDPGDVLSANRRWLVSSDGIQLSRRDLHDFAADPIDVPVPEVLVARHYPLTISDDGRWVVLQDVDNDMTLWRLDLERTAEPVQLRPDTGPDDFSTLVAISPDGTYVIMVVLQVYSGDERIFVWDLDTGQTGAFAVPGEGPVSRVLFLPGGAHMLVLTDAHVWRLDLEQLDAELESLVANTDFVYDMQLSADGSQLAFATEQGVQLFDMQTGTLRQPFTDAQAPASSVVWGPDGSWVAGGLYTGQLALWDAGTGTYWGDVAALDGPVVSLALVPVEDDVQFALGGLEGQVVTMWLSEPGRPALQLQFARARVTALAFSDDAGYLVAIGDTGQALVWRTERDVVDPRVVTAMIDFPRWVAISADGTVLVTGGSVAPQRWNLIAADDPPVPLALPDPEVLLVDATLSADGRRLAAFQLYPSSGLIELVVFQLNSTDLEVVFRTPVDAYGRAILSDDGRRLALMTEDGSLLTWDLEAGDQEPRVLQAPAELLAGVPPVFSPDGQRLAAASLTSVVVWELTAADQPPGEYHVGAALQALAFENDSRTLLVVSSDAAFARLESPDAAPDWKLIRAGLGAIDIRFGGRSQYLVGRRGDGVALVWPVDEVGEEPVRLERPGQSIQQVWVAADREYFITFSHAVDDESTAYVWRWRAGDDLVDLACEQLPRNLSRDEWQELFPDEPYRPTCPGLPIP